MVEFEEDNVTVLKGETEKLRNEIEELLNMSGIFKIGKLISMTPHRRNSFHILDFETIEKTLYKQF